MTLTINGDTGIAALDHRRHGSASALCNEKRIVRRKAPKIRNVCECGRKNGRRNDYAINGWRMSGSVSESAIAYGYQNANETGRMMPPVGGGAQTLTGIEPGHQLRRASAMRAGMATEGRHGGRTHHAVETTEHGTSVFLSVTATDVVSAHPYGLGKYGGGQSVESASAPPRGDSPLHGEATATQPALSLSHATHQYVETQTGAGCG